ncbi:hypothetical protein [Polyangium sp. 15x6]|uniref:hypothetical protein n=1 Tax=Polyangium sp. 15x6 TaxID=3042687 RepID=UPI00249CC606|nr:hypothetical protein [Polyangium sp. 15x6]MDI3285065.1 hypothetical protein [Polyangium sp. 15x6]
MVNVWKVSTLVLAGALVVVVGRGAVQESAACDADLPTAEQITRLKLARGFAFLERAEQEVEQATAARPRERANALAQIAKAKASIELALGPVAEPEPQPLPKPKPRIPRKTVNETPATQAAGTTVPASVVNPFLVSTRKDLLNGRN